MITKEQAEAMDGHTPGPWRVGPVDDTRVEDADGYEVAQIDGDYNEPDLWPKMEANAALIAAAPDMLDTIIALYAKLDRAREGLRKIDSEFRDVRNGHRAAVLARTILKEIGE